MIVALLIHHARHTSAAGFCNKHVVTKYRKFGQTTSPYHFRERALRHGAHPPSICGLFLVTLPNTLA
ncbi:hypothetical protein BSZ35_02745 [Salinibacter sp. 10B]|nr:hypothetical protein BSZ35_02745 [Salinibacter sp. 10B]